MNREMRKTGALPGGSFWKYFWGERTCRRVGHDLEVSYFYPGLRSGSLVCRRCTRMFEPDWDEWEAVHGRLPRMDNFPKSPVEHW